MSFTTLSDARTFETPNAVMRTYASPEVNGAAQAVWRTEMAPGAAGPVHATDAEQVIVVLAGRLRATVGGEERTLEVGDAVVLAANVTRQLGNPFDEPVATLSTTRPGAQATVGTGALVEIPWVR